MLPDKSIAIALEEFEKETDFSGWDYETFISVGSEARIFKDKSQWILGRIAIGIEKNYGESTIDKFAKDIKVPVNSLRVYRWVVKQFPNYFPPPTVSFGVLQAIAAIDNEEIRQELLKQAETEGMSVEAARREVRQNKGVSSKPRYRVEYCPQHDKWHFLPDTIDQWEALHD